MTFTERHTSFSVLRCVVLLVGATTWGGCNALLGIHEPMDRDAGPGRDAPPSSDGSEIDVAGDADDEDILSDAPPDGETPADGGEDTAPDLLPDATPDALDDTGPADVGMETPLDGDRDAPPDGGMDAPPDGGMDAPPDGAVDASPDGAVDAPPDAAKIADGDAMKDALPDGSGSGEPPPVIGITTATLPDALYNVAYSAQLTATGGSGTDLLWRVSSGRLPTGVDLDGAGKLRGVPRESGPFEFEVTVSQAAVAPATRRLLLNVIRKRWLVFRGNTASGDLTLYGLYAVDVRNPNVKLTISSNLRADSGSAGQFGFSPDGAYVAFVGEAVRDFPQLYVVDMREDLPSVPRKVNEFGLVREFAWSPDSKSLAYPVESDQTLDVVVSDVTQPDTHGDRMGNPPQYVSALGFVTPSLLTYFSDAISFSRRGPNGHFEAPASLLTPGALVQAWPELESALFASFGESCMDPTWTLVDFQAPIMTRVFEGYVSAAPGRDYVAHRDKADLKYRIYRAWSEQPLAEFPTDTRFCSPGSWSHDGRMFVTASNDGKLLVTRVQGTSATTSTLAGSYTTLAESTPPVFSSDDRWLGFSTADGAYVVPNDHGSFGVPVGGGVPVSTPFGQPRIRFSPDASRLATGEASSMGRSSDVTIVDLTQPAPTKVPVRFASAYDGSSVIGLGWSVHSTELAVLLQEGAYPAVTNLHLLVGFDLANRSSGQNLSRFDGCSGYPCAQVTAFEFQP